MLRARDRLYRGGSAGERRDARNACDKRCLATWKGPLGLTLQKMARDEVGGSPIKARYAWKLRSPITYARAIASSCIPLQLWWSVKDSIVTDQQRQSARLYRLIKKLNPDAPVAAYHGYWRHSAEMHARTRLPFALATFGLVPDDYDVLARAMHVEPAPSAWCTTLNVTR